MNHGDGGKGSQRRPGEGYQEAWERIFGKRPTKCPYCADPVLGGVFFAQTCEDCCKRMGTSAPHCTAGKVQGKEQ